MPVKRVEKTKPREDVPQLRPAQLASLLRTAIPHKRKILIVGSPGVGKTSIPKQVAAELNYKVIVDHPVYGDPTDAKGIPWFDQKLKKASYFPAGTLSEVLSVTEPTLWIIDDFGQASPAVQASYMPPLLDRTVNGHRIPDCVSVIATTNSRTDRAGVHGLLEPVKSRFDSIIGLTVNLDDSCNYFFDIAKGDEILEDAAVELVGFLRWKTHLLHDFQATSDMTNSPCPRTWEYAMRWVALFSQVTIEQDVELATLQGVVGKGAAAEYIGFQRIRRALPSLDGILLDPEKSLIPHESPAAMYAVSVGLAEKATAQNFPIILRYAQRMHEHRCSDHSVGLSQFVALLLQDVFRRKRELCECLEWIRMMASPIGDLIRG